ncbi:MAG: hypothetical protein HOV81_13875 [Kofleriaceae bacterium]|nr:hypothetical protein [Kofleriaceae bacterium]
MSSLLADRPFAGWQVTRTVDEETSEDEAHYLFEGHGVELICDQQERVLTIFLRRGDGEALSELAFSLSRREVLELYGPPSCSEAARRYEGLGDIGPWDRWDHAAASVHVQYRLDRDEIEMITLMRPDAAPPLLVTN